MGKQALGSVRQGAGVVCTLGCINLKTSNKMSTQERIAKLQWVLHLCVELEQEDGMDLSETKAEVENKIKELSA